MLSLVYAPNFVRQFKKLEQALQDEVVEKLDLFKDKKNHKILKVHKLHGEYKDCYSFSVNYSFRIIFSYQNSKEINMLSIGNHDAYK